MKTRYWPGASDTGVSASLPRSQSFIPHMSGASPAKVGFASLCTEIGAMVITFEPSFSREKAMMLVAAGGNDMTSPPSVPAARACWVCLRLLSF